ncbi:MAG: hypothetical protein U0787_06995 [Polyangia bacterium]
MSTRLLGVADDLRGLGKDKQALPLLEQALRILPPLPTPPQLLPPSELETRARLLQSLCETLWAVDGEKSRARVMELGTQSLKLLGDLGKLHRSDADALHTWLQKSKLLPVERSALAEP